jgi:hypothetical protein
MSGKTFCNRFLILTVFCIGLSCGNKQNTNQTRGKEMVMRLEPGEENPRNSEGDFIQLESGRILFVYTRFTSGAGDHASAHLVSRFSDDQGKTWSSEDVLVIPNEGTMNVMSVSMLRLSDGRIALFYLRKNSVTDCIPFMRISTDEAKSWSDPVRCIDTTAYFVLNNDRVRQLKNGRIILPVAMHPASENGIVSNAQIRCYFSDDQGKTWQKGSTVKNENNVTLQEPGICELANGNLLLYCRTNKGVQYFSHSKDMGENWTPVTPGNIKSPLSPASIERIPETGDLLLVWNNNSTDEKRTPFTLAVSNDEGKSWTNLKTIENNPDGWYCYTAIEFVDAYVLLGHCAGNRIQNNGLETTQITRLHLDWIYNQPEADSLRVE